MCGIIGSTRLERASLERAAETFGYRGPDTTAYFFDSQVALGHHRLSIIDVGSRADQPMWDAEKTMSIVFNGEIYNYAEVKDLLQTRYTFQTTSDTEVLLYAYKEWGPSFVEKIHGMFACAIYDTRALKLFLFRDHAGIKPLYYSYTQGNFAFSSELKGLTTLFEEQKIPLVLNGDAIELYSVFGYIPSPLTLYQSIFKVPKSSWLVFDLKSKEAPVVESYTLIDKVVQNQEEFTKLIEARTLEHLVADVPVGVFFSGGTDSSLIASILHRHGIALKAFSIRMKGKEEDAYYFNEISKKLGLNSQVNIFGVKEFDEIYPSVMAKLDEPISDNSLFPTYYLAREAAKEVKVVLSGEGGDELFLGYPRDLVLAQMGKIGESFSVFDWLYTHLPFFKGKNYLFERLFIVAKQPISYYLIQMSPARGLVTPLAWRKAKEWILRSEVEPLAFDREFYLENDLLKKIDMATSYASIEGRVPLLDRAITANAPRFNGEHLKGGVLKAFLKKILTGYLPPELVYRGKSGFGMNLHQYFEESTYLKSDLFWALRVLSEQGIAFPAGLPKDPELFIRRSPNYCLSLISLAHALHNAGCVEKI